MLVFVKTRFLIVPSEELFLDKFNSYYIDYCAHNEYDNY